MAITHTSEVKLQVHLDENRVPEKIEWEAQDGGQDKSVSKAFLLSVWDDDKKETLKMDLWTKDMPLDGMKIFFYETLVSMSETFKRATQNDEVAADMRSFANQFAKQLELFKEK